MNINKNKLLLPIYPLYANMIINGEKQFIFRKKLWKNYKDYRTIIIFSSHPEKTAIGECDVEEIIEGTREYVWETCSKQGKCGYDKDAYDYYMRDLHTEHNPIVYGIKINNVKVYDEPISYEEMGLNNCPLSYLYFKKRHKPRKLQF